MRALWCEGGQDARVTVGQSRNWDGVSGWRMGGVEQFDFEAVDFLEGFAGDALEVAEEAGGGVEDGGDLGFGEFGTVLVPGLLECRGVGFLLVEVGGEGGAGF